jgi:uncharacterized membrane protein YbhN (UPF0104 family)
MQDPSGAPPQPAEAPAGPPTGARPTRRQVVLRILVLAGILGLVFFVILPRIVDYDAVAAALRQLTPTQLALLAVTSAVAYVANAGPCRVLIPALSWPHAVGADLSARAVVSTIPGPTDIATKFVLYRQWSIPADTASAGIVFAAFFETFSSLVLPLIATVAVIISGQETRPRAVLFALLGLAVLVIATALLMAIVRSEPLARKVGGWLDWLAQHIWKLFRKTPPAHVVDNILELRERSKDTLTQHGLLAFGAAVLAKLAWFLVLEVSLLAVGVTPDVLPPSAVLAAMAVVGIIALVPITPGAVGVTEVAYLGVLTSVAGPGLTEQITAGIMLFRIAQWLAPIPIGWIVLIVLRRGHWGELFGGGEAAATATSGEARTAP